MHNQAQHYTAVGRSQARAGVRAVRLHHNTGIHLHANSFSLLAYCFFVPLNMKKGDSPEVVAFFEHQRRSAESIYLR